MLPVLVVTSSVPPDIRQCLKTVFQNWTALTLISDRQPRAASPDEPDLVVAGCFQGSTEGLDSARRIRSQSPKVPIILLTDCGSEALAVAALRLRLTDYFGEPFDWDLIRLSIEKLLPPRTHPGGPDEATLVDRYRLVGSSEQMAGIRRYIARVAPSPSNVLITGETGTGKEVVAELIHKNSPRANGPFVCMNCAAIPESLLESELFGHERGAFTGAVSTQQGKLRIAAGGTVLLDEIGEMSLSAQAKLLRVIETRVMYPLGAREPVAVNLRFIASTNQELERVVEEGKFRKDLYFRLNVGRIRLTPLCQRRVDIPPLINHFIEEFNREFGREVEGFTTPALDLLLAHSWPGNVRELRNVVESVFVTSASRRFPLEDLPDYLQCQPDACAVSGMSERDRLLSALIETNWNKSQAARKLDWSRMTIYRKMEKYGLLEDSQPLAVTSSSTE